MSKVSIAVIGLNGFLGKPLIEAINSGIFDDKIQFPIKAITRTEPTTKSDKIEYIVADVNKPESIATIAEKLGKIDSFVELVHPAPDLFANIENLLKVVKPKLFIPSQFGADIAEVQKYAAGFMAVKTNHSNNVRALGIKVVDIITSLFATPGSFIYEWVGAFGIDPATKTIKLIGDINQKFHISKLEDVANSVLAISTYPNPEKLPDTFRIGSDVITVKDVIDTYSKNHDNVEFKIVSEQSAADGKQEFADALAKAFEQDRFFWYLQVIVAQGQDNGLYFSKLDNELINPGQSLWKWGKF